MNLVLQNVVFPQKDICSETNLYYRIIGFPTDIKIDGDHLFVRKNVRINFDTYFNSFSIAKWLKFTNVKNVKLHFVAKGKLTVGLFHYFIENDSVRYTFDNNQELVIDSDKPEDYYIEFSNKSDPNIGMVSFGILSDSNDSEIYSIAYETEIDESDLNDVKIAIGTCTYKREKYITKNMEMLATNFLENKKSPLYSHLEVFISDNAKTLADHAWPSDKIHYFQNKNAGGSGGFTRTMMEVINANDNGGQFSHILLMDDDLTYAPESVYRTYMLLLTLNDDHKDAFVCGSMMRTDNMTIQHEAGCHWGNGLIISYKHDFDLAWPRQCCDNEYEDDYQYYGWWYCAMPMTTVRKDNLPLPMFIKIDDAEYGIRNGKDAVYLNGICVWHEPFEFKFTPTSAYYIARNTLICNAIQGIKMTEKEAIGHLKDYFRSVTINLRYLCFDLFCEGVQDFLKGVDWLKENDLEAFHQKLMARCADYKYKPIKDLPIPFDKEELEKSIRYDRPIGNKFKRLIAKMTVNGLLLPSDKIVITDTKRYQERALFAAKKILVVEVNSMTGFVLERSLSHYLKCRRELKKTIRLFKKNYKRVNEEYFKRSDELTNYAFWENKLDLK